MSDVIASERAVNSLAQGRDFRLDFWRGLCLVDMVLVHLVYEGVRMGRILTPVLGEFTRFAAGGFIFLAGLAVTYIFLPKARDPHKRWPTYRALWRRSLYLLGVHYAASLSFIFIYPLRDFAGPYPRPIEFVKQVLLFREGSDLLIFYVIMVALSPLLIEVIRRGHAWAAALLSIALFAVGQYYPYALSLPIQQNFMVILWQMIFVMGMFAGALLPRWDALAMADKLKLAASALAALALVQIAWLTPLGWSIGLTFDKCPLSWGEAFRYLTMIVAIMMTTDLIWRWIKESDLVGFFRRLGRRSLAVYVAHVWVVAIIVALARRTEWLGAWQILLAILGVAMLWSWTRVLDLLSEAPKHRGEEATLLSRSFWKVSAAAVAGIVLLFSVHTAMPFWHHRDPMAKVLAKVKAPTNLATQIADASDNDSDPDLPDMPYEQVMLDDVGA